MQKKDHNVGRRKTVHILRKRNNRLEVSVVINRQDAGQKNDDTCENKRWREHYDALLCLNTVCKTKGKRHYISTGDISDRDTKTAPPEQYRGAKKANLDSSKKAV